MRRPWQVWTLFVVGVALVAAPMAWLTLKALELDRKELEARQQIDIEQRVSRALWRMDVLLMPLLAQEAARPALVYCPTVTTLEEGKGKPVARPSHWSGFRVAPERIEFWKGMPSRLHEREVFHRSADGWAMEMLFP